MDQHPDTRTSEGVKGGLELVDPPRGPPSLVAPKADPPDPPRIIKVPSPEAMSRELNAGLRRAVLPLFNKLTHESASSITISRRYGRGYIRKFSIIAQKQQQNQSDIN
jgi:hypothetical protein